MLMAGPAFPGRIGGCGPASQAELVHDALELMNRIGAAVTGWGDVGVCRAGSAGCPMCGRERLGQDDRFGVGGQFDAVPAGTAGVGVVIVAKRVEPAPPSVWEFASIAGATRPPDRAIHSKVEPVGLKAAAPPVLTSMRDRATLR